MSEGTLFALGASEESQSEARTSTEEARVVRPMRAQLQWDPVDLESLVPQEHPARTIWGFLEGLDQPAFYEPIKAIADRPGRPTTALEVLPALWLLATVEAIGDWRPPEADASSTIRPDGYVATYPSGRIKVCGHPTTGTT